MAFNIRKSFSLNNAKDSMLKADAKDALQNPYVSQLSYPSRTPEQNEHPNERNKVTKKTPKTIRRKVVERWLSGASFRKIKAEYGLGLATIKAIIDEAKRETPRLENLKRLELALQKEKGCVVADLVHAAGVFSTLESMSLDLSDVEEVLRFIKESKDGQIDAAEYIATAAELRTLEKRSGVNPVEISSRLTKKVDEYLNVCGLLRDAQEELAIAKSAVNFKRTRERLRHEVEALRKEKGMLETDLQLYRKVHKSVFGY